MKRVKPLTLVTRTPPCRPLRQVDFPRPLGSGHGEAALRGNSQVLVETFMGHAVPILDFIEDERVSEATRRRLSAICLKAVMNMVRATNPPPPSLPPPLLWCSRDEILGRWQSARTPRGKKKKSREV